MKIVAVSQRVDNHPDRNERRDALDQRLAAFLLEAGYLPAPIPNCLYNADPDKFSPHEVLDELLERILPHAFVLSGGNDIGSCPERDFNESQVLDYAHKQGLPVLGICRGMQMMGVWAGVELKTVEGHVRTRHTLSGLIENEVNSFHHQSLTQCPHNFEIIALSEDGEIEAIRHQRLPWAGWMWHPEREREFSSNDLMRLQGLFQ